MTSEGGTELVDARLDLCNVGKTYGLTKVLDIDQVSVSPGEIHCLVGQNGSGKSTLAKILSGYHAPDHGSQVIVDGEELKLPVHPNDLQRLGVSFVHQNLGLVEDFTVLENIRVGRFDGGKFGLKINWKDEHHIVSQLLHEMDCNIDPHKTVSQLTPPERAMVAIARSIQNHQPGKGLIVFDESTRSLSMDALQHFYSLIRLFVNDGTSVVLISHRLDEVLSFGDRVSVLRDGKLVAHGTQTSDLTEPDLAHLLLGKTLEEIPTRIPSLRPGVSCEVSGLESSNLNGVSFEVKRGEIVGLTGINGSGFEFIPDLLNGYIKGTSGSVSVGEGEAMNFSEFTTEKSLMAGIAVVPESRELQGLALQLSIRENITLPRSRRKGSWWRIGKSWQIEESQKVMDDLGVVPPKMEIAVGSLSGGNQQKVLFGKWMMSDPQFFVLHEPTQGVDVGARVDLLSLVLKIAEGGCGVLVVSGENEDLSALCDRILITENGTIVNELEGPVTPEEIIIAVYRSTATV